MDQLFALGHVPDRNEIAHCARSEGDLPCRLMACPSRPRFDGGMPALTRRRNLDAADECRRVFPGDVRAGTTALRTGMPHHEDPWGWGLRGSIPVAAAARTPARHTSSFCVV
jgi:hypothetical protein